MLYSKIQPQSFPGSGEEDFLSVFTICGHGGHLTLWTVTICSNYQFQFDRRIHMKFEENWPRGFRGEVVQRYVRTMDRQKDDGQGIITIPHPEPSAQVSYTGHQHFFLHNLPIEGLWLLQLLSLIKCQYYMFNFLINL